MPIGLILGLSGGGIVIIGVIGYGIYNLFFKEDPKKEEKEEEESFLGSWGE